MIARISMIVLFFLVFSSAVVIVEENVMADDAIPFTERDGIKYVTVQINGIPIELIFDTGANSIVLNDDALQRLGITDYSTARKIKANTAGGSVEGYVLTLNSVKVGNILKNNDDIAYVPSSTASLLGASFFNNYNYYIDTDNSMIRMIPKGSFVFGPTAEKPSATVERPKTGSGRIEVEVDGKKYIYGEGWGEDKRQEE